MTVENVEPENDEEKANELAQLEEQLAEKTAQFDELSAKMADYEKRAQQNAWRDEVAKELNVPADVLRGETLEELKAHGQQLKELIKPKAPVAPGIEREPESGSLSKTTFADSFTNFGYRN